MFRTSIFIALIYLTSSSLGQYTTIDAGNGLDRGVWGTAQFCPTGSWAGEFELKYAPRQNLDDTCGNGIKLYCYDDNGFIGVYVTSSVGQDGDWQGIRRCAPTAHYLIGYALNVEGEVGNFDDDLGIIDVRMECDDGEIIDGLNTTTLQRDRIQVIDKNDKEIRAVPLRYDLRKSLKVDLDGEWGSIASCPQNSRVCGLQTQVEPVHVYDDDAGLCNMILFCCDYP